MLNAIIKLPFIVILMGIGAIAMLLPGAHAAAIKDHHVMRVFVQGSMILMMLTSIIAIATSGRDFKNEARSHLLAIVSTFVLLPIMLALPFYEAVGNTTFLNAYIEMVSSLTTTGATLFLPERLPPSVHLWRALVGWMGGFFIWLTAIAILAPMNIGGFEVSSPATVGRGVLPSSQHNVSASMSMRLRRYGAKLFPIYAGLTLVLWIALLSGGDTPLVAFCHAMSTLSTSGISPVGGLNASSAGWRGEMLILFFMVFALSRRTFSTDNPGDGFRQLIADPEFRIGTTLMAVIPLMLFARHWFGAIEVDEVGNFTGGLQALWGAIFTVMSFITTTGFVSEYWGASRAWSGLATPGLILMGLALIGGGVATTAGGVKLLRVYALYKHGMREMDRLVHPSSVGGSGAVARRLRRQGAYVAWVFFMLFALSLALVAVLLSLVGLDFETSIVLAIASLSTTGPVASIAADLPISFGDLPDMAKLITGGAMVLGRMETLAIIALLNPEFWRT